MWDTDSDDELLCQALSEVEKSLQCADDIDDPDSLDIDDSHLDEQIKSDEGQLGFQQNNVCVAEREEVLSEIKEMVDRQFHASLSYSQTTRNNAVQEETKLASKDKVHDMPCFPLQKLPGHAGDMKANVDQTEAVFVHKELVKRAKSVGIIRSHSICGTGFRVGPSYIMTAKHVVDQILMGAPVPLQQQMQVSPNHQLNKTNVFIDFSYERNSRTSVGNLTFHFEPEVVYASDYLDTAILKLKADTKIYPPPLTKFTKLPKDASHGHLIGHSRADIKKTDKYNYVALAPHEITAAKEWSVQHVNEDGFVGIDNPERVLLHCSFDKGASGSPGFWICPNNGEAYVVLMLLRGYPDWYYDDKCRHEKKIGIPPTFLIEQAVSMTAVSEDMQKRAPSLWQEIFNYIDLDEEMNSMEST